MKRIALLAASLAAVMSMPGCATRDLGRQSALTDYEKESMACEEIDQEMNKVVAYVSQVNGGGGGEEHGIELVAALEKRWIGNSMERSAALESANVRMIQLWALRDAKKCNGPAPAEARSYPLEKPAVEEHL